VIVSASTAALLEDEPLRDLGRHRLKDFDAPARLFQLGVDMDGGELGDRLWG
jgi:class 3 adenylate cyclase